MKSLRIIRPLVFTRCFLLSGAVIFGAAGCALFGPPPKAQVSLVDITLTNATLFETTADAVVRIENQNPDSIAVLGGVHRIAVNGTELGSGTSAETLELAPYSSGTQRVKLHMSNLSILTKIKSLIESRIFEYDIESELPIRMNGVRRTVDLEESGRVVPEDFESLN